MITHTITQPIGMHQRVPPIVHLKQNDDDFAIIINLVGEIASGTTVILYGENPQGGKWQRKGTLSDNEATVTPESATGVSVSGHTLVLTGDSSAFSASGHTLYINALLGLSGDVINLSGVTQVKGYTYCKLALKHNDKQRQVCRFLLDVA